MASKKALIDLSHTNGAPFSTQSHQLYAPRAKKEAFQLEKNIKFLPTNYENELNKIKKKIQKIICFHQC